MSYYNQTYNSRPPPGWQPPFAGAPPVPSGVNPQVWNNGRWQFNPAFRANSTQNVPPQQVPWAAGQGWSAVPAGAQFAQPAQTAQASQSASFNPYKRQVKPPSEEYMNTKLSENPLGLHDMIPRDQLYGTDEDGVPQTPWIWNPPGLARDETDEGVITADWRDQHGRRTKQETRGSTPSRPDRPSSVNPPNDSTPSRSGSQDRAPVTPTRSDFPPSRQGSHDRSTPSHAQYTQQESPLSRRGSQDYSESNHVTSRSSMPVLGRPSDPNSIYRQRYGPDTTRHTLPAHMPSHASERPYQAPVHEEHEPFTTKTELRTTFSPRVLVVPGSNSSASATEVHVTSHPGDTPDPSTSSSITQLSSRLERLSASEIQKRVPTPLSRHASEPIQPYSSASSSRITSSDFVEEPVSVLSPLIGATPKPSMRPIGRGSSVPDVRTLEAIPESAFGAGGRSSGSVSRHNSVRDRRPTPGVHLATLWPENSSPTPPRTPYSRERHHTPSPGHSPHSHSPHTPSPRESSNRSSPYSRERHTPESNPLPRPPSEQHTSTMAYGPPPRVPTPTHGTWSRRTRVGFWNRRGDHLTMTGHIVYAPPDKANPPELRNYPDGPDGYLDHFGSSAPYDPDRPELPESLPLHGRPPVHPYDHWVIYRYT